MSRARPCCAFTRGWHVPHMTSSQKTTDSLRVSVPQRTLANRNCPGTVQSIWRRPPVSPVLWRVPGRCLLCALAFGMATAFCSIQVPTSAAAELSPGSRSRSKRRCAIHGAIDATTGDVQRTWRRPTGHSQCSTAALCCCTLSIRFDQNLLILRSMRISLIRHPPPLADRACSAVSRLGITCCGHHEHAFLASAIVALIAFAR